MFNESIFFLIAGIPLLLGGIIAIINSQKINDRSEKIEHWFRKKLDYAREKRNKFVRIVVRPFLFMIVKFFDWTDRIKHIGIKDGIRVTSILYFVLIWLNLLIYATLIVLTGIIALFILRIIYSYLVHQGVISRDDPREKQTAVSDRVIGTVGYGERIDQQTGIIQKETPLGWVDTKRRINPKTGELEEEDIIAGWVSQEAHIDQESGEIFKKTLLGKESAEIRVNTKTGIIETKGLFGWEETDERIDPKTNKRQYRGAFGWQDQPNT